MMLKVCSNCVHKNVMCATCDSVPRIEDNIENGCSGCIHEDADGSTDAISNCVCCSRMSGFAKKDYYRKK